MAISYPTTSESDLWSLMKAGIVKHGGHGQRIESPSTGMGIPDVNCTYNGIDFWAELKVVKGTKIKFQPGQPGWLMKRWKAGGLSWVMARELTRNHDRIYVWRGCDALNVARHGTKIEPFFVTTKNVNHGSFDWRTILECMCSRVV